MESRKDTACCICPKEDDLYLCECGLTFCKIHFSFHLNNSCKHKNKKGKKEKENDNGI